MRIYLYVYNIYNLKNSKITKTVKKQMKNKDIEVSNNAIHLIEKWKKIFKGGGSNKTKLKKRYKANINENEIGIYEYLSKKQEIDIRSIGEDSVDGETNTNTMNTACGTSNEANNSTNKGNLSICS